MCSLAPVTGRFTNEVGAGDETSSRPRAPTATWKATSPAPPTATRSAGPRWISATTRPGPANSPTPPPPHRAVADPRCRVVQGLSAARRNRPQRRAQGHPPPRGTSRIQALGDRNGCVLVPPAGRDTGRRSRQKRTVVAPRDPVSPAGGITGENVRQRMTQGDVPTCSRGDPEVGTAHRTLAALEAVYRTHENIVVGAHIEQALVANVEAGRGRPSRARTRGMGPTAARIAARTDASGRWTPR